ncbi:hypothetical protein M501DRAFT_994468 [Patellaria atrata CBS 101060]|uniref:Uncharacterized protein n=1 Tax=Patellaria atrata CBS 101060 TaxID=1346257 RepID=A0A9P4VTU1_9PEZI|nr:hypothetical protein M501DRAFT_994468 [Patellaria atrata CBS 101060]
MNCATLRITAHVYIRVQVIGQNYLTFIFALPPSFFRPPIGTSRMELKDDKQVQYRFSHRSTSLCIASSLS